MLSKLFHFFSPKAEHKPSESSGTPEQVKDFYNTNTDKFIEVYGDVIQAFRTKDVKDYLDYTIQNAELKDGLKVLDAGCGVGGPASYFAEQLNIDIKGLTISDYQAKKSKEVLGNKQLKGRVEIMQANYHEMDKLFG